MNERKKERKKEGGGCACSKNKGPLALRFCSSSSSAHAFCSVLLLLLFLLLLLLLFLLLLRSEYLFEVLALLDAGLVGGGDVRLDVVVQQIQKHGHLRRLEVGPGYQRVQRLAQPAPLLVHGMVLLRVDRAHVECVAVVGLGREQRRRWRHGQQVAARRRTRHGRRPRVRALAQILAHGGRKVLQRHHPVP